MLTDKLSIPGEHLCLVPGKVGLLEVVMVVPEGVRENFIALIGHPHSLQGGTMNNKVVTTIVRAFKELGVASIRFNFRGVGQSEGVYDAGLGESEDMLMLANSCLRAYPATTILFAGFSFGSYVTYRAAGQCPHALLVSVAPSVHGYDYTEFMPAPNPWVVIQGDADELVPLVLVEDFVAKAVPPITLLRFSDTSHFFHGKLIELKSRLKSVIMEKVPALCL